VKLAELQAKFQDAIVSDDRAILDAVNPSRRLDRAARFAVYAEAYHLRLAGFLAEDYRVLRNAIGDEMFGALVEAYIGATLSHHPNARWYARQLPEFMQKAEPWRHQREWIDLAALERALADAFDARDADAREIGALGAIPAEARPRQSVCRHARTQRKEGLMRSLFGNERWESKVTAKRCGISRQ